MTRDVAVYRPSNGYWFVSGGAITQFGTTGDRGVRTDATVVSTEDRAKWFPEIAEVRYLVDGRRVVARLTVWSTADFPVGSRVEVIYDPEDPDHAKPVDGWLPSWVMLAVLAALIFGVVALVAVKRSVVTLEAIKAARRANGSQLMRAESFTTRHGWGPWSSTDRTVALWPGDADPGAGPAPLYMPAEDSSPDLRSETPVTVLGHPGSGQYVTIIDGDGVVWPRRGLRDDPPRGKIVEGRVG